MSGLIFEGDTVEKFGKLFPNPFIQQIRVFDDLIEVDVALFFEVPIDEDETATVITTLNQNLRVFGAFLEQSQFDNIHSTSPFYANSFFTLYFNNNDFKRTAPLDNIQYHFNSEGEKFAKALVTFEYVGWNTDGYGNLSSNTYFASFTSFDSPGSTTGTVNESVALANLLYEEPNKEILYKNQTSDLVYEKIFNADGTLNVEPKNVFREPNGNAYNKTPIQSLSRDYKKSNQVTHQTITNLINPIISPFVGTVEEANLISTTLTNYSNDPAILTQLQKNINSFSNKSSTTSIGRLYSDLVDAVSDIDNLLQPAESLSKRLETSDKILDKRGDQTLIGGSVDTSSTKNLSNQNNHDDNSYIYSLIAQTTKNYYYDSEGNKTTEELFELSVTNPEEVSVFKTSGYIFFDYEKTLNYKPKITSFFNTYNLEQIFGKNCLNSYYKIISYELSKKFLDWETGDVETDPETAYSYQQPKLEMKIEDIYGNCTVEVNGEQKQFFVIYRLDNADGYTIERQPEYTYLRVLPFKYIRNGANYKLIALEFVDFNKVELRSNVRYTIKIDFADTTHQFYDIFMRQRVFDTFDKLSQYYEFANQFCSYNNLDNKFNDFFVSSVTEQFEQPYPWEEAPLVYHSMRALLESSYDLRGSQAEYIPSNRRKDGSLINMEILKNQAILESKSISPATGDLQSLEDFYNKFQTLREVFVKGQGLDNGSTFYDPAQEGYELKSPDSNYRMTRDYDFIQDYDLEVYST